MNSALARFVWETRYRHCGPAGCERSLEETWARVAAAIAAAEPDPSTWHARFLALLLDGSFLPGGRIIAGAGTGRDVTLLNCFVMGEIEDSIPGIFAALGEGALTLQHGGGIGYDFSTLRPQGDAASGTGTVASGPVSFLQVWDAACAAMVSSGTRGGAMMGVLRCDHPDIEAFIDAKRQPGSLSHFNLSVLVSDALMRAVARDADWPLLFPAPGAAPRRVLRARDLWRQLVSAAHASAEPGVLFVDHINSANHLRYCEHLTATNPCAELPLPPYGGCDLGSLVLPRFVQRPFTTDASLDHAALAAAAALATRFLDDVIEVSRFPLPRQRETIRRSRRVGLGITGLADALAMLGLRYDSPRAREAAATAMRVVREAAIGASVALARERGPFPAFVAADFLASPGIAALPAPLLEAIARDGIRNSHLTAIAPAGSISLLGGNLSSGIEPLRSPGATRRLRQPGGGWRRFSEDGLSLALWRNAHPGGEAWPEGFVFGPAIGADDQLRMLAALQPEVDSGISKTVELPADATEQDVARVYELAWELGLKGCAVFRQCSREAPLSP